MPIHWKSYHVKFRTLWTALLFVGLMVFTGNAQSFPVQVTPQLMPSPPSNFSTYADPSVINGPLRVQLLLNDLTIVNREIRLRVSFEGNGITFQSNTVVVGAPTLFLEGGVPLVLEAPDLAPYFELQNLVGISPTVYGNPIPEGTYQFCFEVMDVLTGNPLSSRSCATALIFSNEPPFLVAPQNATDIEEQNPQYIFFQWSPRQINVSNVAYELSMVEIRDNAIDPQAAFLSTPPVFQTTTTNTTFLYGPTEPLLLSGNRYAWRIQVRAGEDGANVGAFNNQGFSEVFYFNYTVKCELPQSIFHEIKGSTQANISWEDYTTDVPEFTVRYRESDQEGAEWFTSRTNSNWLTLWNLKPGTTYEYQISKTCGIAQSDWSFVREFTTAGENEPADLSECGIVPNIDISNEVPLESLRAGQKFEAGDFTVNVLEVDGSNGRFSGKGYVSMPYLENIKMAVEFTNIFLNAERQMAEGMVITAYDPDWGNILDTGDVVDRLDDVGDVFTGGDQINIPKDGNLDYDIDAGDIRIDEETGEIVITKPDGTEDRYDYDEGDRYTITDKSGNSFNIDEDGNITQTGEGAEGGAATAENTDGISPNGAGTVSNPVVSQITATGVAVIFSTNTDTKYELDVVEGSFERSRYPKLLGAGGEPYYPVHKAVVEGNTDTFLAKVTITNDKIARDSLIFKTVKGTAIPAKLVTGSTDTYVLTITGKSSYQTEEAIVSYKGEDGKYKIAASFFVHHIKQQNLVDVVVVSVNGTDGLPNFNNILNGIFNSAGASFRVSTDRLQLTASDWDTNNDQKLNVDTQGLFSKGSNYPKELRQVFQTYKQQNNGYNKKAYYLFVMPESITLDDPSLGGLMPKTRQWGFVFNASTGNSEVAENKGDDKNVVAAHELGHGVFRLAHPFEDDKSSGSGTDWLMDYGAGDQLSYSDWALMSDESLNIGLFQDQEDAEIAGRIWFTPAWEPFKIGNSSIIRASGALAKVKGTVPGFRLDNGLKYDAEYNADGSFKGYFSSGTKYPLNTVESLKPEDNVYLFEYVPKECNKTYLTKYGYVNSNRTNINLTSSNKNLTAVNITTNCDEDICAKGQEFFDAYKDLPTVEGAEEDYLREVAKLICQEASQELVEAYKAQYEKWNNTAKSIAANINLKFSWEKYYDALLILSEWRQNGFSELLQNFNANNKQQLRDKLFRIAFRLDQKVLELISLEQKIEMLTVMLDGKLFNIFGYNQDALVVKVVQAIKDDEAKEFLDKLVSSEYYNSDNNPLIYVLKEELADFLNSNNPYTGFFREIKRLSDARNLLSNSYEVQTIFNWDVEQKDYFLLSFVKNRNDYEVVYDKQKHLINVRTCISCCYTQTRGQCSPKYEYLLREASPFDLVGIQIINDVSPFGYGCEDGETLARNEYCGKIQLVPAIFLNYLQTKVNGQQLENFGWNTFNIITTIAGVGEVSAAVKAIRAANGSKRFAVVIKHSYELLDFSYSVTDEIFSATNTDTPEVWKWIGYAFGAKSVYDAIEGGAAGVGYLRKLIRSNRTDEALEIAKELNIKKDGKELTEEGLKEFVDDAEAKIQQQNNNSQIKAEYEKGLSYDGPPKLQKSTFLKSDFDELNAVVPQKTSQTNLGKKLFETEGLKIKPENGLLRQKINEIITKGKDEGGFVTEEISDLLYQINGFKKYDVKLNGNQGIDGLYIKGDLNNPDAIHIDEAKFSKSFDKQGVKVNSAKPDSDPPLPVQMSDDWIENVANRMLEKATKAGDDELETLANMLLENPELITKSVTTISLEKGTINILKLDSY